MKDLIIDCFAGGGGASVGIEMALGRQVDIAINHDRHFFGESIDPEDVEVVGNIFDNPELL